MDLATILYGLGSIGVFSSRAFLPAFLTALSLRLGPEIPFLRGIDLLQNVGQEPVWFTHWVTITILGVLAALEIAATKQPEARDALEEIHHYLKTGAAVLCCAGVIGVKDAAFVEGVLRKAGFGDYLLPAVVGAGVFCLAWVRRGLFGILREADPDDDLGVQGVLSWLEDLWASFGLLLLLLFPLLMVACIVAITGLMVLLEKRAERKEEESKVPCGNCGHPLYPSAMGCPKCQAKVQAPCQIGIWGQPKAEPARNLEAHPYRLVEKKRCPVCATRFKERKPRQTCAECGHELMKEPAFRDAYVAYVRQRLPAVCGISFLLSLIPVFGLIPGVIYYRMALVSPFRRYIPLHRSSVIKWLLRLFFFVLIGVQWVPLLGGVVIPVMAWVSHSTYRSTFQSLAKGS